MTSIDGIIEAIATNVISWTIVAATFNMADLIPSTENIVQWTVGMGVGLSVMIFNIIRSVQAYDDWKHNRKSRNKPTA